MHGCHVYTSERKLGEYFFSRHFQIGFSKSIWNINFWRGFQHIPHSKKCQSVSKEFQRVSKGFPKGFQRVSKGFRRVSKGFSNSLIIYFVISLPECPILVSWMSLETQWKMSWKPHVLETISNPCVKCFLICIFITQDKNIDINKFN